MTVTLFRFDGTTQKVDINDIIVKNEIDYCFRFLPSIQIVDSVNHLNIKNVKVKVAEGIFVANSPLVPTGPINYLTISNLEAIVDGTTATPFIFNWGPDVTDTNIPVDELGNKIKNGNLIFQNIKVTLNNSSRPIFAINPNSVNNNTQVEGLIIKNIYSYGGKSFLEYTGQGSNLTINQIFHDPQRSIFGTGSDGQYSIKFTAKSGNIERVNLDQITIVEGRTHFIKLTAESGNISRLNVTNFDFKTTTTSSAPNGHFTLESQGAFAITSTKFIIGNISTEATSGDIFGWSGSSATNKKALVNELFITKKVAMNIVAPSNTIYTVGDEIVE